MVVWLGGWWFTVAVGLIVHLGLLEYFRMAQFKGIRPATKTTLVAVQLLLFSTQAASQAGSGWLAGDVAAAVLPASGAVICGWLLLQPVTGTIADIAAWCSASSIWAFCPVIGSSCAPCPMVAWPSLCWPVF